MAKGADPTTSAGAGGRAPGDGAPAPEVDAGLDTELDSAFHGLLTTPAGRADPYPAYAVLRERAPIFRSSMGMWVVTRFEHCQQVLRVPHFAKGSGDDGLARMRMARWGIPAEEMAEFAAFFRRRQSMLSMDPPDHTRLRGLVSRAFTPSTVESLRPAVAALCDELLETLAEKSADGTTVDVMTELAFPLPVAVIGELLGVPVPDRASFQGLVRAATTILEPSSSLDDLRRAREARQAMETYFSALIEERRARPQPDLLSELIAVSDGSDRLSEEEVMATAILLFAAGFETTTNLIGNGLLALLHHPDQLALLRRSAGDAGAVQRAVEELLRFDSPVQLDSRVAMRDLELVGMAVGAGESVMTLIGSANRDPRRFPDPDALDLARDQGPPMSFGAGIHHCLGAALARMEGQVCFARLLTRFARIELRDDVTFRNTITLRGVEHLGVRLATA